MREDGLMSSNQKNKSPSPHYSRNHNIAATHIERNMPDFNTNSMSRDKLI